MKIKIIRFQTNAVGISFQTYVNVLLDNAA